MADYSHLDTPSSAETPPPAHNGSGNRTFATLIGILGVIFLIALALMAAYLLVLRPRQSAQQPLVSYSADAKLMVEGTATSLVATRDALLALITQTPGGLPVLVTETGLPSAPAETLAADPLATPTPPAAPAETQQANPATVEPGSPAQPAATSVPSQAPPDPTQPQQATQPAGQAAVPTQADQPGQGTVPTQPADPGSATQPGDSAQNATPIPPQATATLRPALAASPTNTPVMIDARTATVSALLTQAASNVQPTEQPGPTSTAITPAIGGAGMPSTTPTATATALPQTGFAEDAGIPGLMGVAIALLIVIVLARGLRTRTSS